MDIKAKSESNLSKFQFYFLIFYRFSIFQNIAMNHIKIPGAIISQFVEISSKNISTDCGHIETLAFLIGNEIDNEVIATELVFPKQDGTPIKVDDLGIDEYNCFFDFTNTNIDNGFWHNI